MANDNIRIGAQHFEAARRHRRQAAVIILRGFVLLVEKPGADDIIRCLHRRAQRRRAKPLRGRVEKSMITGRTQMMARLTGAGDDLSQGEFAGGNQIIETIGRQAQSEKLLPHFGVWA